MCKTEALPVDFISNLSEQLPLFEGFIAAVGFCQSLPIGQETAFTQAPRELPALGAALPACHGRPHFS